MRLFRRNGNHRRRFSRQHQQQNISCEGCSSKVSCLADVPPGCQARVIEFGGHLRPDRYAHLQAYGVVPGHWVRVVQHSPVMIIRIDHTEIALETEMAREVKVEEIRR